MIRVFLLQGLVVLSIVGNAQQVPGSMSLKEGLFANGYHVIVDGSAYGPSAAIKLCVECSEARSHFQRARRLRRILFALTLVGTGESTLGAITIEDASTAGILHASIGGVWLTMAAQHAIKARQQVKLGVDAYNRCYFLNEFMGE